MQQPNHASEYVRCLEELDVEGITRLHRANSPHMPAPANRKEALASLHLARTLSAAVREQLRFYSHRWLTDAGYPSGLPDELKPRAERAYPQTTEGVGISVNARSSLFRPIVGHIRGAMESAVLDAYADGKRDPLFVKERMREARTREIKKLVG